jgi:hypothetical protein
MSRFLSYLRRHHIALLALFVAMGGTSYAAFKLPSNSVGSKQIKANAVNASKVKNGSLLAGDFKAGQLPAGAQGVQGLKGDKGDPCLASDPNCKGPKGDTGAQGPGARSFDVQFAADGFAQNLPTVNGVFVSVQCSTSSSSVDLFLERADNARTLYAFGTKTVDGTLAALDTVGSTPGQDYVVHGTSRVELGAVARAPAAGEAVQWTRFDVSVIRGSACNVHAMVTPAAPAA